MYFWPSLVAFRILVPQPETEPKPSPLAVKAQSPNHWLLFSRQVMSSSFVTPWSVARQAPLSMGFPRQEYWRGLPFPSPGDLPDQGIELASPALQVDSLLLSQFIDSSVWMLRIFHILIDHLD